MWTTALLSICSVIIKNIRFFPLHSFLRRPRFWNCIHILLQHNFGLFWPTHYVSIDTILNVSKTGHFLDPPTQAFADVIYGWSHSIFFTSSSSHDHDTCSFFVDIKVLFLYSKFLNISWLDMVLDFQGSLSKIDASLKKLMWIG